MALILVAPTEMTAPLPDTPRLPRPGDDFWLRLRASTLALADGASVENWLADGSAPAADRTFASKISTWSFPVLDADGGPGGRPAVYFNKSHHISNFGGTSTRAQPMSYAIVARNLATAGIAGARYIGGFATGELQNVQPTSATGLRINAGNQVDLVFDQSNWFTILVTFNGANSLIKLGAAPPVAFSNPGPDGYKGLVLGGQNSTGSVGTGLGGWISEVRAWSRALSVSEMNEIYAVLATDHNL